MFCVHKWRYCTNIVSWFLFFLENILVILWNKDHGKIEKENWRAGMIIKNDIFILLHS